MATTTTTKTVKVVPYVDWSAVAAGTLIAITVSILLSHFGGALGFTFERFTASTETDHQKLWHQFIIIGLWTLWTQLMASMAGGYAAGVARRGWIGANHESEIRDGAHGLLTWAMSTVLVTIAAAIAAFWAHLAPMDMPHPAGLGEVTSHKMAMVWGFSMAMFSLVSAVAAWWTGTLGGDHRDRSLNVSERITFRTRR